MTRTRSRPCARSGQIQPMHSPFDGRLGYAEPLRDLRVRQPLLAQTAQLDLVHLQCCSLRNAWNLPTLKERLDRLP